MKPWINVVAGLAIFLLTFYLLVNSGFIWLILLCGIVAFFNSIGLTLDGVGSEGWHFINTLLALAVCVLAIHVGLNWAVAGSSAVWLLPLGLLIMICEGFAN